MSELLLELYSEEMPFYYLKGLENNIKNFFNNHLLSLNVINDINDENINIYITPCRIIVYLHNLDKTLKIKYKEIIGPKLKATEEEVNKFLEKFNLQSKKELKKSKNYYILVKENYEIDTKQLLEEELPSILSNMTSLFPENIRWLKNNKKYKWLTPLRNILCMFDNEKLNFTFCGLKSNNYTYGHKILIGFDKKIEINNFEDYKTKMKENFVIYNQEERKNIIDNEIIKIEKQLNSSLAKSYLTDTLKNEILYSTEYPLLLATEFKEEFIKMPAFILLNEISSKYKCLCLTDTTSNIMTNKIILFADTITYNDNKTLIQGISNSINKRLNYINNELIKFLSESLETKIDKLKNISYYDSFGTIYDKVERLVELSKFICLWLPHADLIATEQTAKLSKIDSTTKFIKDNPDLKGYLSAYYAKANNYNDFVCDGLKEYYSPKNKNDTIPSTNIGKILSIADKIDNISSAFIIDSDLSGSNDPYFIRKNISSIVRIILESQINIPLTILIHKSLSLFKTKIYKTNYTVKLKVKDKILYISNSIIEIFKKKFTEYLVKNNYNKLIIKSVLNASENSKKQNLNLLILQLKIAQIEKYLSNNNNDFVILKNTYKRLHNITINFENTTEKKSLLKKLFHKRKLKNLQEKELNKQIKEARFKIKKATTQNNYELCFPILLDLSNTINNFFNTTLIESKNKKDTNRKLLLLYKAKIIFDEFLDFNIL